MYRKYYSTEADCLQYLGNNLIKTILERFQVNRFNREIASQLWMSIINYTFPMKDGFTIFNLSICNRGKLVIPLAVSWLKDPTPCFEPFLIVLFTSKLAFPCEEEFYELLTEEMKGYDWKLNNIAAYGVLVRDEDVTFYEFNETENAPLPLHGVKIAYNLVKDCGIINAILQAIKCEREETDSSTGVD